MKLELTTNILPGTADLWYYYNDHAFLCAEGIDKAFDLRSTTGERRILEFSETPKSLESKIIGIRKSPHVEWNWAGLWTESMAGYLRRYLGRMLNEGETKFLCVSLRDAEDGE